jgi:predicted TIM-barrel fold metal-dependent hydrolase
LKIPFKGVIDVDLHPPAPVVKDLVRHLDDYWADQIVGRNIDRAPFALTSYPPNAPITCRPDWRGPDGRPGGGVDFLAREALDRFGTGIGVANFLHGAVALHNPDMAAALVAAINDHMRAEWLDRDSRLRGSILVSLEDPALAVAEIERCAADPRFVQVALLAMQEAPIARRIYWPIFEAAERHGLAIAVHAGSLYRHAPSVAGWPSHQFEDYVLQSLAFENLVVAFLAEGVFQKFPKLKLVMLESGFMWLPTVMWRIDKTWKGVRQEVPWLDRKPTEILKDRLFVSLQPADAPDAAALARTLRHIGGTDMLLFSSDYPHRQFEGDEALPDGLPPESLPGVLVGNALRAYPRLAADPAARALADAMETA